MRDEEYETFNGVKYVCQQLPGWDGVGLFFELTQLIGEPAMVMITRAFSDGDLDDIDAGEVVGSGVYAFVSKLSAPVGIRIMKIVFAAVRADGEDMGNEQKFNHHFKGETLRALKVFAWALRVNFQSFLDESRLASAVETAKSAFGKAFTSATSTQPSQHSAQPPMDPSTLETSP